MESALTLQEAYERLAKTGEPANFVFNGGAVGDAAAFGAIYYFLAEKGVKLRGIIENPYPQNCDYEFNAAALGLIEESDYILVPNARDSKKLLRRMTDDFIASPRAAMHLRAATLQSAGQTLERLVEPFFIIGTYDKMISLEVIQFVMSIGRPLVYVLLDDGVAYKTRTPFEIFKMPVEKIKNPVLRKLHIAYASAAYPRISKMINALEETALYLPFTLFQRLDDGFRLNDEVRRYLARSFKDFHVDQLCTSEDYSNTAILIATKSEVYGLAEIELEMMKLALECLADNDIQAIIKPHPLTKDLSRYESLGVPIDRNQNITIETQLANCQQLPVATIGLISTGQIYGNLLFNVPNISYSKLVEAAIERAAKTNPAAAQFLDSSHRIERAYSDDIIFATDEQDLRQLVEQLAP